MTTAKRHHAHPVTWTSASTCISHSDTDTTDTSKTEASYNTSSRLLSTHQRHRSLSQLLYKQVVSCYLLHGTTSLRQKRYTTVVDAHRGHLDYLVHKQICT